MVSSGLLRHCARNILRLRLSSIHPTLSLRGAAAGHTTRGMVTPCSAPLDCGKCGWLPTASFASSSYYGDCRCRTQHACNHGIGCTHAGTAMPKCTLRNRHVGTNKTAREPATIPLKLRESSSERQPPLCALNPAWLTHAGIHTVVPVMRGAANSSNPIQTEPMGRTDGWCKRSSSAAKV